MIKVNESRFRITFEQAKKLIKPLVLIEPGPRTSEILKPFRNQRNVTLDILDPTDGICIWCNVNRLPKKRRKYCSEVCCNSAHSYCYNNTNHIKGHWLVYKQECACAGCGESFEEMVRQKIENRLNRVTEWNEELKKFNPYGTRQHPVNNFSTYYAVADSGHIIQVDHITPIHRGGDGIGFSNIQILCINCHKAKTTNERTRS